MTEAEFQNQTDAGLTPIKRDLNYADKTANKSAGRAQIQTQRVKIQIVWGK